MFFSKRKMSLREAEEVFKKYGCSSFHIAREYGPSYSEARIPQKFERQWRTEVFNDLLLKNSSDFDEDNIWVDHSNMVDLANSIKIQEYYEKLLVFSTFIQPKVTGRCVLIITENLIGRTSLDTRQGLLHRLQELGYESLMLDFIDLIDAFLDSYRGEEVNRYEHAKQSVLDLRQQLNL